jgi:hypothetical protein
VSFGDRIRGFFARRSNPELEAMASWAQGRKGLEGFIEPRTATNPTTLLLVDREGDHRRVAVRGPHDAVRFCDGLGIPVYDARVIGYPQRMKDFEKRGRGVSASSIDQEFAEIERRFRENGPGVPDH